MKKVALLGVILLAIFFLNSKVLHAEVDDANVCKHDRERYETFKKEVNNVDQNIFTENEIYSRMLFMLKTSRCSSFKKEHKDEISGLEAKQRELMIPIEKTTQSSK